MRIHIEHTFAAPRAELERLYMLDDEFNRQAFQRMGYARKVIERQLQGSTLRRVLHLCPMAALPGPFSALAPAGLFYITEQIEYDFARHQGRWQTTPSVLTKQFRAEGELALYERESGAAFVLTGEAKAHLPLLSGRAEKQAVQTAEQQHAALAQAIREQLTSARSPMPASSARP